MHMTRKVIWQELFWASISIFDFLFVPRSHNDGVVVRREELSPRFSVYISGSSLCVFPTKSSSLSYFLGGAWETIKNVRLDGNIVMIGLSASKQELKCHQSAVSWLAKTLPGTMNCFLCSGDVQQLHNSTEGAAPIIHMSYSELKQVGGI